MKKWKTKQSNNIERNNKWRSSIGTIKICDRGEVENENYWIILKKELILKIMIKKANIFEP